MKKVLAFSLLGVLALAGCQTKELEVSIQESKHFTATIEDNFNGGDTKTYIDEQGNVRWKKGDQVSIFAGSTANGQYQVTDASDGKTSAGFNPVSSGGFIGGGEIDNNVAFYPYASTAELAKSGSSYIISDIALPTTQSYAEASFGNGAFPMAAVTSNTDDMHLKFKNVLGGLKLQLTGTDKIASISITGNRDEILCGAAEVTVANGSTPSINLTDASAKTVTLDCSDGVQLNAETATAFVIALPPMTMASGFTVVVTDTDGGTMEIKTTRTQTINRSSLLKMPAVNYVGTPTIDYATEPFTITSNGATSVSFTKVGDPPAHSYEYKKGDGDWLGYSIGSAIELADKETLQLRQKGDYKSGLSKDLDNYYTIQVEGSGNVIASGNIMSLLDGSLEIEGNLKKLNYRDYVFYQLFGDCSKLIDASKLILPATTLSNLCYKAMFRGCSNLTAAPELLPATTLAPNCYDCMFLDCNSLTVAPELPATTMEMYCYRVMFGGCSSLTAAPALPATTLATFCYENMFKDCSSLTAAPALPATTLASSCYEYMFKGCSSLTAAPELPATTLASSCYEYMFEGCSNLTTAPELPATTLFDSCYDHMFKDCSSLTTAPELPALTLKRYCYNYMFAGCSKLNYIEALFTSKPGIDYTYAWLKDVSSTGTFVKNKDATWDVTGFTGIPSGWDVLTE